MLLGNAPKFGGFSHWRNWVWANAHRHWCLNHNLFRFWPHTCTQTGTETHVLATQHLAAGVCASTLRTPCKPHTEHLCLCLCVCVCLCEVWVVDQQLQLKDVYTLHRVYLAASHPRCPTRLKDPLWRLSLSVNVHDWWMRWKWAVSQHMPHLLWHH